MIRRRSFRSIPLALGLLLLASAAHAAKFDLIYTDEIDVTLCPDGCGITVTGDSYALLVNTGATDIGAAELFATTFTCTSTQPQIRFVPFINNPGPPVAPIHPNEAVGSALNALPVLTPYLVPRETLRNTYPLQVLAFQIERVGTNSYAGTVVFNIRMTMGTDVLLYSILANVTLGGPSEFAYSYPHAVRRTSGPLATPARPMTWGAIKQLYH